MKSTIKEEKQTKIIKEEYLNDNSLLVYKLESNKEEELLVAAIQYIKSSTCLKEDTLFSVSKNKPNSKFLSISADNETIAVFEKEEESFKLRKIYEVTDHSLISDEFIDIVYANKFSKSPVDETLRLVKRRRNNER